MARPQGYGSSSRGKHLDCVADLAAGCDLHAGADEHDGPDDDGQADEYDCGDHRAHGHADSNCGAHEYAYEPAAGDQHGSAGDQHIGAGHRHVRASDRNSYNHPRFYLDRCA
jgi:hypothetical protein